MALTQRTAVKQLVQMCIETIARNFVRVSPNLFTSKIEAKHINIIIDIEMNSLLKRIEVLGYKVTISKKAKDFIAEKGFDKQYGARPLKRAIQKYVEDAIAEEIIKSNIQEGDSITMDIGKNETELKIKITSAKTSEEK